MRTMRFLIYTIALAGSTCVFAAAPSIDDKNFQNAAVNTHNTDRAKHGVAGLKWNDTVAKYAQKTADNCDFVHSVRHSLSKFKQSVLTMI